MTIRLCRMVFLYSSFCIPFARLRGEEKNRERLQKFACTFIEECHSPAILPFFPSVCFNSFTYKVSVFVRVRPHFFPLFPLR